jgi:hypothetical protein
MSQLPTAAIPGVFRQDRVRWLPVVTVLVALAGVLVHGGWRLPKIALASAALFYAARRPALVVREREILWRDAGLLNFWLERTSLEGIEEWGFSGHLLSLRRTDGTSAHANVWALSKAARSRLEAHLSPALGPARFRYDAPSPFGLRYD